MLFFNTEEDHPRRDESICSLGEHLVEVLDTSEEKTSIPAVPAASIDEAALQQPTTTESRNSPVTFNVEIGQEAQEQELNIEGLLI